MAEFNEYLTVNEQSVVVEISEEAVEDYFKTSNWSDTKARYETEKSKIIQKIVAWLEELDSRDALGEHYLLRSPEFYRVMERG